MCWELTSRQVFQRYVYSLLCILSLLLTLSNYKNSLEGFGYKQLEEVFSSKLSRQGDKLSFSIRGGAGACRDVFQPFPLFLLLTTSGRGLSREPYL